MPIKAEFTADFSQFNAAAAGAVDALGTVTTAAEGMAIDRQAERAGAAIGTLGKQIYGFSTDYLAAFAEEEKATQRLTSALEATGTASTDTIKHYQDMASEFQKTTRFSDDAVLSAQTLLTQIGKIGPEEMEPAVKAAADLATQLGISLPDAAKKIATVIATDGAKLGDLKGYLSDVELKGKSAADIIAIFNSKFGGAAAKDMETYEGHTANLANQFDDMKGKAGALLADALTPLLDAFASLPGPVQSAVVLVTGLGVALAPVAIAFGAVVTAIGPLVALLGGAGGIAAAVGTVAGTLTGILPILAAVAAAVGVVYVAFTNWDKITGFVKGVYDGIKTWLVDGFNALVDSILAPIRLVEGGFKWLRDQVVTHSYVTELIDGIATEFARLNDVMVTPATEAADATEKALGGAMGAIGQLAGGALAGPGGGVGGPSGINLPGTSVERSGYNQYLVGPNGTRVPMERTGTGSYVLPANWYQMLTGGNTAPISSAFTGTPLMDIASGYGQAPVNVIINGSVLSTQDQIASMVGDAMTQAYRKGGNLLPV